MSSLDLQQKDTHCPLASYQLEVDTDGKVRPCCNFAGSYGSLRQKSLTSLFNSAEAQSLRKNLSAGKRDERCGHCWKLEDLKVISKREQALTIFENYQLLDSMPSSSEKSNHLQKPAARLISMDLKQSNVCNLKCRTCSPFASSKWYEEFVDQHGVRHDEKLNQAQVRWFDPNFWLNNEDLLLSLEKIDFYGGEPLADPHHLPFLNFLIAKGLSSKLSLVYGSNGTLVNDEHFAIWKNFKRVKLQLSQDGLGSVFEFMRFPAKWSVYHETIQKLKAQQQVQYGVTVTFGALNLMHLPETLNWLYENKIEFATNPVVYPSYHSAVNLPEDVKASIINKFQRMSLYKPWMSLWLNEAISFMTQKKSDPAAFNELLRITKHSDQWRKQNFTKSLPLTALILNQHLSVHSEHGTELHGL